MRPPVWGSSSKTRLDIPSLFLTLVGLIFGGASYWLITAERANPLIIVPSVVAVTIGATHLLKREAPRD